ncbi:hypothetical protein [Rhodococcus sp. H29-C3]|uniref:hypothetical protein n=1 Tax=Rhodococcus sp. H29-C3 TaxID=3046307 RepID=UPI0024BA38F0|nr:hypothetical protein [Rhodococcus sp. H29-C3]MDJ0359488.1 hypothetical protein [Rhodococcus sp. H29-C3]
MSAKPGYVQQSRWGEVMSGVNQGRIRSLASSVSERDPGSGREIGLALDRCFARIRIQVSGRVGVGKSSVRAVLTASTVSRFPDVGWEDVEITETAAMDVPSAPDPDLDGDVVVYVLTSGAQKADVDAVASASHVVPVLAKADTVDDLVGALDRLTSAVGIEVFPLMGTIARAVSEGEPKSFEMLRRAAPHLSPDMMLTRERFLRADIRHTSESRDVPTAAERDELVERIEILGVRTAVEALGSDPTMDDVRIRLLLLGVSGAARFTDTVRQSVERVRIERQARLLHRLTELAAEHPTSAEELETFLASDEAVLAIMRSALDALGETAEPGNKVESAALWLARSQSTEDPNYSRAARAISRGYLRMRARS